jgi:hypothetical protein
MVNSMHCGGLCSRALVSDWLCHEIASDALHSHYTCSPVGVAAGTGTCETASLRDTTSGIGMNRIDRSCNEWISPNCTPSIGSSRRVLPHVW